ncbi:hypothetical protein BX666DRAFT_1961489 [Dichotomocladium elegans]|nr:hypothetical protein BX666DRAFT_1961489 [Dichotomocladium elegans]
MNRQHSYDHKRKIDDSEDIWEREASSSTRLEPPNEFAKMISVLNDQNDELKNSCRVLEENLATLETSLTEIEKELSEENHRVEEQNLLYDRALYKTIELVQSVFCRRDQDDTTPSRRIQDKALAAYLEADKKFYEHIDRSLEDVRSQLPFLTEPDQEENQRRVNEIENEVTSYHESVFTRVRTKAKCKALEAKTVGLEKELRKLNGLPQILQIVRTTTEAHRQEARLNQLAQRQLMQERIVPSISKVLDSTVRQPLMDALQCTDVEQLQTYSKRLDEIHMLLIKQRAAEQLIKYACEADAEQRKQNCNALTAFIEELDESITNKRKIMEEFMRSTEGLHLDPKQDEALINQIDKLLSREYLKKDTQARRRRSFNEESILTKVNSLLQHEKRWKEKWNSDFGASIDAIKVIEEAKHDLLSALYEHSVSQDNLIMLPSSYTDAQDDLEMRTNELQDTLADLVNESTIDAKLEETKRLLALFLTDPHAFGEEIRKRNEEK